MTTTNQSAGFIVPSVGDNLDITCGVVWARSDLMQICTITFTFSRKCF